MVVADFGHRIHNHLAVKLQHDAEHAVNGGMVGSEVEEHELRVAMLALQSPLLGVEAQRFLFGVLPLNAHPERFHLRCASGVVLSQRVALPGSGQQNAKQVGVTGKVNAVHVPGFTFVPVGVGVNPGNARNAGVIFPKGNFQAQIFATLKRHKVVDEREIRLGQTIAVGAQTFIDTAEIKQHFVSLLFDKSDNIDEV